MANELTASAIADMIPVLKAQAILTATTTANIRNLVTNYTMENGTLTIPKLGSIAAAQWSEASTLSNTAAAVTNAVLTSSKWGIQLPISKEAISRARSGNTDLLQALGTQAGVGLNFAIEKSLAGLFAGLDHGIGTTSSDKLTVAKLADGIASIADNSGATTKLSLVARPLTMSDLMQDAKLNANISLNPNYAGSNFYQGSLLGVDCYNSTAMTVGSNCATSAVFAPTAMALGIEAEPEIFISYFPKEDTHYMFAKCEYGVIELYGAHGYYFTVHA